MANKNQKGYGKDRKVPAEQNPRVYIRNSRFQKFLQLRGKVVLLPALDEQGNEYLQEYNVANSVTEFINQAFDSYTDAILAAQSDDYAKTVQEALQ